MQKNIIGVDLGATSGRVILARAGDDRLRMEELHRFPNRMREIDGRFYWDIHALYEEILRGLLHRTDCSPLYNEASAG